MIFRELDAAAEGIKLYFDKALGSLLLYKFERQQYSEILKSSQNRPMSDIYGAEHLLRLLGISSPSLLLFLICKFQMLILC